MKKTIAALLMIPSLACADFQSGNELYAAINSDNSFNRGLALGYIEGVFDLGRSVYFCPPKDGGNITAGQVNDIVNNFLQENPSIRNVGASLLVMSAAARVWPCPKGRGA